jgi:hypothetical protein
MLGAAHQDFVQDDEDIEGLLQEDSGIIKHRGKIASAVHNAAVCHFSRVLLLLGGDTAPDSSFLACQLGLSHRALGL